MSDFQYFKYLDILCLRIVDIRGNIDSLLVGAGEGQFGLWLDSSLYQGRSQACSTYRNTPLVPGGGDFVIKTVECWAFD